MRTAIYMLLLAVFTGCQHKGKETVAEAAGNVADTTVIELTIDPDKIPAVPFDSLMDDVKFVRLQTDDRCLVGVVDQFICTDNYIFIMDRESARAVFCFDMQGRFVRKIGRTGSGSGEYVRLCNIALSADKEHLIIVDWAGKLLYYDFYGNLVKAVKVDIGKLPFDSIEEIDNQIIAAYYNIGCQEEDEKPMLTVANSTDGDILYRTFPTYQTKLFRMNNGMFPFRKYGGNVYLNKSWTQSFYKVGANGCTELYRLHIAGGGYPEITDEINDDAYIELLNKTTILHDYVFLKDVSVFFFSPPKVYWHPFVVYFHETGSMLICSGSYTNPLFEFYSTLNTPLVRQGDNTYVVQHSAGDVLSKKRNIR